MEPANFAELRSKIDSWDITAEELLLQKMKIFTINYNEEFQQFCKNMDNFSNHIESVEIEHLKAINQINTLSTDKFIEHALDKGEESESESISNENNITEGSKEIQITNVEKMKTAINISLDCLNTISKKNKNKEEIEDDTVSVTSSKIVMDSKAKVRLPFIIGTDEFKADKAIGLNVAREKDEDEEVEKEKKIEEEEEERDSDVEEFLGGIDVDKKQKEKWEKIRKKKKKKMKKKKEKEKKKLEASKTFANNVPKNEEPEVKVPIENEGDNQNVPKESNFLEVSAPDPSKSGGAIPPPPPPPPPPPQIPTKVKIPNTSVMSMNQPMVNPYALDAQKKK